MLERLFFAHFVSDLRRKALSLFYSKYTCILSIQRVRTVKMLVECYTFTFYMYKEPSFISPKMHIQKIMVSVHSLTVSLNI